MASCIGQRFGNYRLLHVLGTGGFAEVYLGEHIHLGTPAAIKVLHSQLQLEDAENFRVEARKIARLAHPYIVRVLDFGVENQIPFLVMDYAPHGTLRQRHLNSLPLQLDLIIAYIKQIAPALQYVHEQKLIHRDIKPENMLVSQQQQILLSDFGIAVAAHSTGSLKTQNVTGTGAYMAPEQIQGKPRLASDQYALGVVVYEWLSGSRPFDGSFNEVCSQHLFASPLSLRTKNSAISPSVEQVVLKALAKEPHERFGSVQIFADALIDACQPKKISITATPPPIQPKQSPIVLPPPLSSVNKPQGASNNGKPVASKQECFLCALDPHPPCAEKKLEGYILAAYESNINGEMLPFITINTDNALASIRLTSYYRSLVKGLIELGKDAIHKHKLILRLYHLPIAPTVSEYKGQPFHRYMANSYTLAVLEPDVLLNITDLSQAEYCSRQYLLKRLVDSPPSAATIQGNLIHYAFKELLKEHDRGKLLHGDKETKTPLDILHDHFEKELQQSTLELAFANISAQTVRDEAMPHLESLALWFQNQSSTLWDMPATYIEGQTAEVGKRQSGNQVRAETFLLAPEIGLRGRLDLFWQQSSRQRLLELKTGKATGDLPKEDHRWQVKGYHALLTVRRDSTMKKALATLLYSGTAGEAYAVGIPFSVKELQRVNEKRNILMLSHITGTPSAPPGPKRCTKCVMLLQCTQVSSLLNWRLPEPDISVQAQYGEVRPLEPDNTQTSLTLGSPPQMYTAAQKDFFARFFALLQLEEHESEQQLALLWREDVKARAKRGVVIEDLQLPQQLPHKKMTEQHEWIQTFACDNKSELRQGDEILLSDGNPITGEVVTGTIVAISANEVTVWTPELIAHPKLLDRYDSDIVHVRTLKNLLRWLQADLHLQDLVSGKIRPRFQAIAVPPRHDFNDKQNLAVKRALQMQDYLLIQGPPGTGKTSVIAEIVKRLCQRGQRVLLAAFTNQAVDNMLKRLDNEDFSDYVRLGHERSVDAHVKGHLLKGLVEPSDTSSTSVYNLLLTKPVVASTTATWSSDKYSPSSTRGSSDPADASALQFDVAIIDEASQLTIPAILGALRFAKRFILVGDENQLSPLVLSKEAAEQGLDRSLFLDLKKEHPEAEGACVSLEVQYRMNQCISHFASQVFYNGTLKAAPDVANKILELPRQSVPEAPWLTRAIQPSRPLVFIDVRNKTVGEVKTNDAEARAVRAVVKELLKQKIPGKDIGLIAPFRAQVANLRHHLFSDDSSGWSAPSSMSIDTVDRFQGGERMVIIMSFALMQPPIGELREFITNPHRLNVALTRAQRKLIVVGCAPALEGLPYFSRLLTYCRSMGTVISYNES